METISWGHKNWIQFLINPLLWLCVLITSQNDFLLEDLLNSSPVKFRLINTSCCNSSPHMPNEKMIVYQHATNTTEDLKRKMKPVSERLYWSGSKPGTFWYFLNGYFSMVCAAFITYRECEILFPLYIWLFVL